LIWYEEFLDYKIVIEVPTDQEAIEKNKQILWRSFWLPSSRRTMPQEFMENGYGSAVYHNPPGLLMVVN
jgi:hypothetical protein